MLSEDRRRVLLASIDPSDGHAIGLLDVCRAGVELIEVSGASIMLMTADEPQASLGCTDEVSELIEELQFTYGEGPCIDAHLRRRPVLEPDLTMPSMARWPVFSAAAVQAGARAVFGFPIHVGPVRLGALNLYRTTTGSLTKVQHDDALVVADSTARTIVATQTDAAPGSLGSEVEHGAALRFVVHQATGMVAAQLGVTVAEALVRLRARAFADGRLIADVAEDVVARRTRLASDHEPPSD